MKTLVPKHIAAVSMMVVVAAATLTGMACQNDGNTVPQEGRCENIITESTLQEFRIFTAKDGKIVRGRVLAYSQNKGTVTIAKKNGRASRVDLSALSKADQTYVREWHHINDFFSQDRFHISVRKKRSGAGMEYLIRKPEEFVIFDIMLKNRCDFDMNDLTLDYCIYYEVDRLDNQEEAKSQGVKCGTLDIGTLAAGEKTQVKTQPVVVPNEGGLEYYKDNKVPSEKTLGIRIRIYLPLDSGEKAMRKLSMHWYSMPNTRMKYWNWIAPAAPDTMNN